MHTEPRAARVFLLASLSPRPGDRCRYHARTNVSKIHYQNTASIRDVCCDRDLTAGQTPQRDLRIRTGYWKH